MRGGAIPPLVWGTLILIALILNLIWEGAQLRVGLFAYTVLIIYVGALVLFLLYRPAARKGEPEYESQPDPLPRLSLSAAGAGISIGLIVFGLVFGKFLIYLGGALLLAAGARLARELRAQRRTLRRVQRERRS